MPQVECSVTKVERNVTQVECSVAQVEWSVTQFECSVNKVECNVTQGECSVAQVEVWRYQLRDWEQQRYAMQNKVHILQYRYIYISIYICSFALEPQVKIYKYTVDQF